MGCFEESLGVTEALAWVYLPMAVVLSLVRIEVVLILTVVVKPRQAIGYTGVQSGWQENS